jgi:hypothetical protein
MKTTYQTVKSLNPIQQTVVWDFFFTDMIKFVGKGNSAPLSRKVALRDFGKISPTSLRSGCMFPKNLAGQGRGIDNRQKF